MKYKIVLLLLCCPILSSCSKNDDNTICDISNPIEELEWLNGYVTELKSYDDETAQYFYISEGIYKGQEVFIFDNCCPFCNTVINVFDCQGENIGALNSNIENDEIKNRKIIYHPEQFACRNE